MNDEREKATWTYRYDLGGNILEKRRYAYTEEADLSERTPEETIPYAYGDASWKDLLTSFDGKAITYDEIGNPISYDGRTFTWKAGRQLAGVTSEAEGLTASYEYNHAGLRVRKSVNGTETRYIYNGKRIMHMERGNEALHFSYDAQGRPLLAEYGGAKYAYVHNLQGDITGLIDPTGQLVVQYSYDAWGRPIGKTGSLADTLGTLNPFRYRSYVFDEETGLYCIAGRYYDPDWVRFLIADCILVLKATPMALTDKNLFAYCDNDPISRTDESGLFWDTVLDSVSFASSIISVCLNPQDPWAWVDLAGDAVDLIPFVTGVGETVKAVTVTVRAIDETTDVVQAARQIRKTACKNSGIRRMTGAYIIEYARGSVYVGKGDFYRSTISAKIHASREVDRVVSIKWTSAFDEEEAFIMEYKAMNELGGSKGRKGGMDMNVGVLNIIWSPGKRIYENRLIMEK